LANRYGIWDCGFLRNSKHTEEFAGSLLNFARKRSYFKLLVDKGDEFVRGRFCVLSGTPSLPKLFSGYVHVPFRRSYRHIPLIPFLKQRNRLTFKVFAP
jgi:hypothetical protein